MRFDKIDKKTDSKGGRAAEFYVFFRSPLYLTIDNLCGKYKNKKSISNKDISDFCSVVNNRNASRNLILLPSWEKNFISLFYQIDNIEFKKAIIKCFLKSDNYILIQNLLPLLSKDSKEFVDSMQKNIRDCCFLARQSNLSKDPDEIK